MTDTWLAPGLSTQERTLSLEDAIGAAGWKVGCWPGWTPGFLRRLSQTHPLTRRIVLRDGLNPGTWPYFRVLAHEWKHARRAEEYGRVKWVAVYALGPALLGVGLTLLVLSAILTIATLASPSLLYPAVASSAFGLVLLSAGAAAWSSSEKFRRREEVLGFAAGAAAQSAYLGHPPTDLFVAETLHSYAYPYLVGGRRDVVKRDVERETKAMLREAEGD